VWYYQEKTPTKEPNMFKKIAQKRISDEIIQQFKGLLGKGELNPGDELPAERELAEMMGVSRPPLREALNALQAMGFIEIKPRSKIIVKSFTQNSLEEPLGLLIEDDIHKIFELLELRRAMEGWAAFKAARTANREDIDRLEVICERDRSNLENKRDDAKTDADFHLAVALAAHNTFLSHLMNFCHQLLWNTQKMARQKIFIHETNRRLIVESHRRIFEAIKNGDPEKASREARDHIDFVEKELKKVIAEESHGE